MLCLGSMRAIKRKYRPHKQFSFPDTLSKHLCVQIRWLNAEPRSTDSVEVMMMCFFGNQFLLHNLQLKSQHLLLHKAKYFNLHLSH